MKHISILLPQGDAILPSIIGTYSLLNQVNAYLGMHDQGQRKELKIDIVGLTDEACTYKRLFQIKPTKTIDQIDKTDLIIITTITGNLDLSLKMNAPFVKWILEQRISGHAEVASLCTGAFLLAETGLLNGKSCTTHWIAADAFRKRYPQINLLADKIICEDNGIYSSGGAYSFLNLLLHIIEKYVGREAAIWCSKVSEIEFDRVSQNPFIIFNGQKDHQDESIKKAQEFIENNFEEKLNIEELASKFAFSRRNFIRRFKKATSNTPIEYIQRVKVEAAKKSLESSTLGISQIMYKIGYNDDKAFRKIFKKYTGLTPMEYRRKYNPEMALI